MHLSKKGDGDRNQIVSEKRWYRDGCDTHIIIVKKLEKSQKVKKVRKSKGQEVKKSKSQEVKESKRQRVKESKSQKSQRVKESESQRVRESESQSQKLKSYRVTGLKQCSRIKELKS